MDGGIPDAVAGLVVFCAIFALFVVGYTILSIGGTSIPTILTNDPKQRPFLNFTATLYQYVAQKNIAEKKKALRARAK